MKRSNNKKVFVAFLLVVSLFVCGCSLNKSDDKKESEKKESSNDNESARSVENANFLENEFITKAVDKLPFPKELPVFEKKELKLDENIAKNLKDKGWNEIKVEKINEDGIIELTSKDQAEKAMDAKKIDEIMDGFLADSGLKDIFKKEKIEYMLTRKIGDSNVSYCYIQNSGARTGAYIAAKFNANKSLVQCKGSLYKSEVLEKVKCLPIKEVTKKAFMFGNDGLSKDLKLEIKNIDSMYVNGIPYYHMKVALGDTKDSLDCYGVAIDIDKAKKKDDIDKMYKASVFE